MESFEGKANVKTVNGQAPDGGGNVEVPQISKSEIVNYIYPVGSLYWSSQNTDPATLFGGTWKQIKDKFILAAGDTYAAGSTGGAASVALTVAQLPAHNHSGSVASGGSHTHSASSNSTGSHTHVINKRAEYDAATSIYCGSAVSGSVNNTNTGSSGSHSHTITVNNSGSHTHTLTIDNTGRGDTHENMPPYETYYCWERIS